MNKVFIIIAIVCLMVSDLSGKYFYEEMISMPSQINMNDVSVFSENSAVAVGDLGVVTLIKDNANTIDYVCIDKKPNLKSVVYLSENHLVTVGEKGFTLFSTDGGQSWIEAYSNTSNNLNSVYFINSEIGFAAGDGGTVIKTDNGGRSWVNMRTNISFNLYDITATSLNCIFAVGVSGTVIKSTDMGVKWELMNTPTNVNFQYVSSKSTNKIYIMGDKLTFLIYDNDLNQWTSNIVEKKYNQIFTNPEITSCYFKNELEGVLKVNDDYGCFPVSYDYYTSDGGYNWFGTKISGSKIPWTTVCMDFSDSNIGILISNYEEIYKTEYNVSISYHLKKEVYYYSYNLISARKNQLAMSYDYGTPVGMIQSENWGNSWFEKAKIEKIGIEQNYMLIDDIDIPSYNKLLITANDSKTETSYEGNTTIIKTLRDGIILKSDNFGDSWKVFRVPDKEGAQKIEMCSEEYGLLLLDYTKRYMVTNDGGSTWSYIDFADSSEIKVIENLYCISPDKHIILCKNLDTLTNLYVLDGVGKINAKITLPPYHHDCKYISDNVILAFGNFKHSSSGYRSIIVSKTTDGGFTWNKIFSDQYQQDNYFRECKSFDNQNFVLYSYCNAYITTDGGMKWESLPNTYLKPNSGDYISSMDYISKNELILVTTRDKIVKIKKDGPNSIDELINTKDEILISPNPAKDYITINPGNKGLKPFAETDEHVEIYNSFGELVMKDVPHLQDVAHLNRINVSHLPVGLYFVKIGDRVEKFVKK